jgi:hypothetical protein
MYDNACFWKAELRDDRPLLLMREKNTCFWLSGRCHEVLGFTIIGPMSRIPWQTPVQKFLFGIVLENTVSLQRKSSKKISEGFPLKIIDIQAFPASGPFRGTPCGIFLYYTPSSGKINGEYPFHILELGSKWVRIRELVRQ